MDCIVHGVAKSWTQPSDFHFTWSLLGLVSEWALCHHTHVARRQSQDLLFQVDSLELGK